jgi:hypothetical protein
VPRDIEEANENFLENLGEGMGSIKDSLGLGVATLVCNCTNTWEDEAGGS